MKSPAATRPAMSRLRAAGLHLALSLVLMALVVAPLWWIWFPAPLLAAASGTRPLTMLLVAQIGVAPLLTLIVFRAGKRGMTFDMWFIGTCQVLALAFGLHAILSARPLFLTHAVDRFVVIAADQLSDADLAAAPAGLGEHTWSGPILVSTQAPTDPDAANALLLSALNGRDIEYFPRYYVPYADNVQSVIAHAKPLSLLASRSVADRELVKAFLAEHGPAERLGFLPLVARKGDMAIVIARDDGHVVGYLRILPW